MRDSELQPALCCCNRHKQYETNEVIRDERSKTVSVAYLHPQMSSAT